MTVAHIISDKGRNVVTVRGDVSMADAVTTLAEKRIGAVVVVEGSQIRGILSERDVVRALANYGPDALTKQAAEFMTAKIITCSLEDTVNDVMQKMTTGRFRHLPVLENGQLAGIVSIGDVVKRRIEDVEKEADQIREYIATA